MQAYRGPAGPTSRGPGGHHHRGQIAGPLCHPYCGAHLALGGRGEPETLASAYRESLKLAAQRGLKTVAFPSISTGAYGYPMHLAAEVALKTVLAFLQEESSLEEVTFVLYTPDALETYRHTLERLMPASQGRSPA